jgi:hypothetical protein
MHERKPHYVTGPGYHEVEVSMEKPARYTVILERERDGGYVATVPVLPGCVSQGDTREQALENIREAIELYV